MDGTDQSPSPTPFIPSKLDDAGLTAQQFRVFCRIARRGICNESVPNMAAGIRLDEDTVWSALRVLIERNMIAKNCRPGRSNMFSILAAEQWTQPTRNDGAPETAGRVVKPGGSHPKRRGDRPPETAGHEGNPIEGNPTKVQEREKLLPEIPPMSKYGFDDLADRLGVASECANWFWNTHDARNWTDATGQPIRKIQPLLLNCWANWQAKSATKRVGASPPRAPFLSDLKAQLEAKKRSAEKFSFGSELVLSLATIPPTWKPLKS